MLELPSDFGLPALLEGEYRHSIPQARHREQIGLALEHLTFARKQPSQDARSRGWRGFEDDIVRVYICMWMSEEEEGGRLAGGRGVCICGSQGGQV